MPEISIGDDLDLYDAEVQEILQIAAKLSAKYSLRQATYENMRSLQEEAIDLYEQAGWLVVVSLLGAEPEIEVLGRVEHRDFDPDRQQWEVKKGVAEDERVKEFLRSGGTTSQKVEVPAEVDSPEKQEG
jgi:hypothetical protein